MRIITGKWYMLPLLLILSVSCNKGDQALIKPILQVEPFSMKGFAVEPIDQYFDGVKVQELYGTINETKEMAFIQEETVMELRNKTTGEVLYTQKFNSKDAENKVPRFYFDGSKVKPTYEYPAPQGAEYTANFFFDFPKEMGAADVVMVFVEYYEDPAVQGGYAIAGVTNIPIATNIQTGKWSEYIKLPTTPDFPPQTRPDTYFELFVCVRKTGSDLYFTNTQRITPLLQYDNAQINAFSLELPYQGVSQGKVQSYYIGLTEFETGPMLTMKQDLVQLFR